MRTKEASQTLTATSPSSATTAIGATIKGGFFRNANKLVLDASLLGATGGTLDVYLQRKVATDVWRDFVHFPQLAAGAAAIRYTVTISGNGATLVVVGTGTDASAGTPALAVNTVVDVIPGGDIRMVFVSGVSTTLGAAQTVIITPYSEFA